MKKVTGDANSVTFGFSWLFYFEEATQVRRGEDAAALWQTVSNSHSARDTRLAYGHGRVPLLRATSLEDRKAILSHKRIP